MVEKFGGGGRAEVLIIRYAEIRSYLYISWIILKPPREETRSVIFVRRIQSMWLASFACINLLPMRTVVIVCYQWKLIDSAFSKLSNPKTTSASYDCRLLFLLSNFFPSLVVAFFRSKARCVDHPNWTCHRLFAIVFLILTIRVQCFICTLEHRSALLFLKRFLVNFEIAPSPR